MQSARPLEKNSWSASAHFGFQKFLGLNEKSQLLDEDIKKVKLPFVETGLRYGIYDSGDFGFKLSFTGLLSIDSRITLLNQDSYALASGLGFGYGHYTVDLPDSNQKWTIYEHFLPVYFSYNISKDVDFHCSLKLIRRFHDVLALDKISSSGKESLSYLNQTYAVSYKYFFSEAALIKSLRHHTYIFSYSFGLTYDFHDRTNKSIFVF